MNYIKHLNAIFQQFSMDSRLNPTHVSLYMALFQYWNINRFPKTFHINREEIMKMAKIGSKATYHRCLNNLNDWVYIHYLPSHNPYKGSQIKMLKFSTSYETTTGTGDEPDMEQALVSNTNINKQITNNNKLGGPKNEIEVISFFKTKKWSATEALKFYNHYKSLGWHLSGKTKIKDWRALAVKWMIKSIEIKHYETVSLHQDNLKTSKNKDYGKPL